MHTKKYQNSDTLMAKILEVGDVFRTDSSYKITDIRDNDTTLWVEQSIDTHIDTGQQTVNFNTPICTNTHYSDRTVTSDEILRVK